MPPKPRQVRIESKSALAAMQQLESRSDEELEKETRFKSAAQAILGTRAAERMDAQRAREHFRAAIAVARPQQPLQLRQAPAGALPPAPAPPPPTGEPSAPPDGRGLAGPGRAPAASPEGGHGEARRH